jgi:hypothetical protein
LEIRRLIREMSTVNPFWGAPRTHGELVKLGIDVGQTSVAKYGRRSFVTMLTGSLRWTFSWCRQSRSGCLLITSLGRRQILWFGVTAQPMAEWITNQLTGSVSLEQIPR